MKRRTGKPALLVAMLLFPLLALAGGWLGGRLGQPLARVHRTVQLADRIWLENVGRVEGTTVASDTFRATGRSESALYRDAVEVQRRFSWGARLFGAFVGAVLGGKLIRFSVRRRQEDYEADRTTCLSCGRCFMYCPRERLRRKQREGPSASDSAESRGPARACDWRKKW
jgi:NAD-dependent dihydropyrimidine dehydrogenase PreA subunit